MSGDNFLYVIFFLFFLMDRIEMKPKKVKTTTTTTTTVEPTTTDEPEKVKCDCCHSGSSSSSSEEEHESMKEIVEKPKIVAHDTFEVTHIKEPQHEQDEIARDESQPRNITLNLSPIYRYCCYCSADPRIFHFYTTSITEFGECTSEDSPGYLVETKRSSIRDTNCSHLVGLYSYWDVGNQSNILITAPNRTMFENNPDYNFIEFMGYCAPEEGYCGADMPLITFDSTGIPNGRVDHFYTTNEDEAQWDENSNPWYEHGEVGILCYLWDQQGPMYVETND